MPGRRWSTARDGLTPAWQTECGSRPLCQTNVQDETMSVLGSAIWNRLSDWDGPALTVSATRRGSEDLVWTGHALHDAARRRGHALSTAFGRTGRPIVLAMPHGQEFALSLLGAIYGGITVVPVALPRDGVHKDKFNRIVADCGASAILCLDEARVGIDAARVGCDGVATITTAALVEDRQLDRPMPYERRSAIVQYTSGSSRFPRGVKVTGENVVANARHCEAAWGFGKQDVFVNWLPHFHDMGLMGILDPILAGAPSHQLDPLFAIQRPGRWLRLICDTGGTASGGPAFGFAHCLRHVRDEDCDGLDLSRWRLAFCGAEPVPASLLKNFRDRFAAYGLKPEAVFGCYGLAEYTLLAAGAPITDMDARAQPPESCALIEPCALPIATADAVRIVDPDTHVVMADGQAGEIWLRGPSTAAGYIGDAAESAATFDARLAECANGDSWLRTGDLGVVERDALYVTGRLKDVLTVQGRKVTASEIEWLGAQQDPALNPMAAAAVMPDEMTSGQAVLLIEMRAARTAPADAAALRERIRQLVMGNWGIDLIDVRFLDRGELPRTSSGKVQRRAAMLLYNQGHYGGEAP